MILLLGWNDYDGPQLAGIYETLYGAELAIQKHTETETTPVVWTQAASDEPDNYYSVRGQDFRYYEISQDTALARLE